jgi:hypothetical protein
MEAPIGCPFLSTPTTREPGSGICLDACTPAPVEVVKNTIQQLGYTYQAIDIGPATPEVQKEDLQALSFEDDSIDQIFSCDTLEHIPDHGLALREMYRVPPAPQQLPALMYRCGHRAWLRRGIAPA